MEGAAAAQQVVVKFQPFSSFVDYSFWQELSQRKLDQYRLSESAVELSALFSAKSSSPTQPLYMRVSSESFSSQLSLGPAQHASVGKLINTNTIEAFTSLDRKHLIASCMQDLTLDIDSGVCDTNPHRLVRFLLITFADLKQYKFLYWFAFPVSAQWKAVSLSPSLTPLKQHHLEDDAQNILHSFFSLKTMVAFVRNGRDVVPLSEAHNASSSDDNDDAVLTFAVADSGNGDEYPGWNVRCVVQYLAQRLRLQGRPLRLLLIRGNSVDDALERSKTILIRIDAADGGDAISGWESDLKGKSKPRQVNLASQMDPKKLLTTAVDLNLKLMKWRLAPQMKLDQISQLRCLLLGAGTLGCNVARCLLGWGCRNITFVDSGKVSFSNPVRQSLFAFEDCVDGGKPKALAAAESCKRIFPECNAHGVALRIPMPGHPIGPNDEERVRKDHDTLLQLVKESDVVFLLTDSREARWLGTVMGAAHNKIVINAALGFDSYLVMRHGHRSLLESSADQSPVASHSLGCYFCNDVVAPTDSLRERTLDQQCTVTRPGVSMMASAMAVEMLVALLHHPKGPEAAAADAPSSSTTPNADNPVGLIPHQIRGFLGNYSHMLIVGHAYDKCTACSAPVLRGYCQDPFGFVQRACSSPSFLEDLTGLSELKNEKVNWELSGSSTGDEGSDDFSMD